jgi:PAS domain-containing protein
MFGKSDYILCKCDKQFLLTYVNESFLRLTQWQYSEVIGKPQSIFYHPNLPRAFERFVSTKMNEQGFFNGYLYGVDKHQNGFWLFVDIGRYYGMRGDLLGYELFGYPASTKGVSHFENLINDLLQIEKKHPGSKGVDDAYQFFLNQIGSMDVSYDEFVCTTQGV